MLTNTIKFVALAALIAIGLFAMAGPNSTLASVAMAGAPAAPVPADTTAPVTATETLTPTSTPVATSTSAAPVITPTATSTTAVTPTATSTTAETPTQTATSVPATATMTPTVKARPTLTPTTNITATITVTPAAMATTTVTPTAKATATVTPTKTATATPTKAAALAPLSPRAGTVNPLSTFLVVQNADSGVTANITATFFYSDGTTVTNPVTRVISPNVSTLIDQRATGGGLDCGASCANWQGSVILNSNTQLAAVVFESSSNISQGKYFRADTYAGFASDDKSTSVLFPQLLKNMYDASQNVNYSSSIAIQNTSLISPTHVSILYTRAYPYPAGVTFVHPNITIPPGASKYIYLDNPTDEPNLPNSGYAGMDFYGTGLLTTDSPSDPPVVAIANNNGEGSLIIYAGFASANGSKTLFLPQLVKNETDPSQGLTYGTGFMLMKSNPADTSTAHVTVTYSNFLTKQTVQATYSFTSSLTLDQRSSGSIGDSFYGSATVTSDQDVIAIVNLVTNFSPATGIRALTSRAYSDKAGTPKVLLPLLFKSYYDAGTGITWFTGFAGRLMSNTPCTVNVTYYYLDGSGGLHQVNSKDALSVSPSDPMFTYAPNKEPGLVNNTLVSGVVTCNDGTGNPQPIVVNVNTVGVNGTPGDAAATYAGINK